MWDDGQQPRWHQERHKPAGYAGVMLALRGRMVPDQPVTRRGPQPPMLPRMERAPARVACAGQAELFEDCSPRGAEEARKVCGGCPAREWCDQERRHAVAVGLPITGTWAGITYAPGTQCGTTREVGAA